MHHLTICLAAFSAARPLPCRPAAFLPPDGRPLPSCLCSTGSPTIPPRPHCSGYTHPTPPTVSGLREHSSGANLAPVPPDTGMPASVPSLAARRARFEYLRPCAACRRACRKRRGLVQRIGKVDGFSQISSLACMSAGAMLLQSPRKPARVSRLPLPLGRSYSCLCCSPSGGRGSSRPEVIPVSLRNRCLCSRATHALFVMRPLCQGWR